MLDGWFSGRRGEEMRLIEGGRGRGLRAGRGR